eukprot:7070586-Lingulodinium_polyedra.AAC.1
MAPTLEDLPGRRENVAAGRAAQCPRRGTQCVRPGRRTLPDDHRRVAELCENPARYRDWAQNERDGAR